MKYAWYQCQKCGEFVGLLGRFLRFITFGNMHKCVRGSSTMENLKRMESERKWLVTITMFGHELTAEFLGILDGYVTYKVDGFECSNSEHISKIVKVEKE